MSAQIEFHDEWYNRKYGQEHKCDFDVEIPDPLSYIRKSFPTTLSLLLTKIVGVEHLGPESGDDTDKGGGESDGVPTARERGMGVVDGSGVRAALGVGDGAGQGDGMNEAAEIGEDGSGSGVGDGVGDGAGQDDGMNEAAGSGEGGSGSGVGDGVGGGAGQDDGMPRAGEGGWTVLEGATVLVQVPERVPRRRRHRRGERRVP